MPFQKPVSTILNVFFIYIVTFIPTRKVTLQIFSLLTAIHLPDCPQKDPLESFAVLHEDTAGS